jgi:hypothetical protein
MKLERLIFKNDKGEFVDIPAREIESLYDELGKLLDGLTKKKANEKDAARWKQVQEIAKTLQEKREKEEREEFQRRQSPMPPNWPEFPIPSWPYPLRITCEEQPLRFEWDGIEGDKVRLRATQQYRFVTSAPA